MYNEPKQDKVFEFYQHLIFTKLLNSGATTPAEKQISAVERGFNMAYDLLKYAVKRKDSALFFRIFRSSDDLIPHASLKDSMAHPEIYSKLQDYRNEFLTKVDEMVGNNNIFLQQYRSLLQNQK